MALLKTVTVLCVLLAVVAGIPAPAPRRGPLPSTPETLQAEASYGLGYNYYGFGLPYYATYPYGYAYPYGYPYTSLYSYRYRPYGLW